MNRSMGFSASARSARNQKRSRLNEQRRRRLAAESLERRILLAADTGVWHNAAYPEDVNGDARMTSLDALLVVNDLNRNGPHPTEGTTTAMVDVNGDAFVSSLDALKVINGLNRAEGEEDHQVRIRLAATPVDSMDPISALGVGEDFLVRAFVQDLTGRGATGGVFGAYLDVTFSSTLAENTGPIQFSDLYTTAPSGDISAGLFDEIGASDGLTPLGEAEQLLFSVPMRTLSTFGTLTFAGDPADIFPLHDTLLFGINEPIPTERIEFVDTSVTIASGAAPVAADDSFEGVEDQTLTVDAPGVLANDSDADGDSLTAVLLTDPANGSVTLAADGSFSYQPNENFEGSDTFTYAANDGVINSSPATVTLTIAGVNDAPVAQGETYSTGVNETLVAFPEEGILANDFDPEGSPLTAIITGLTTNGVVNANANGSFSYVPLADFVGTDSFQYVVSDGELTSAAVTTTIVVSDNIPPVGLADAYAIAENTTLEVPVEAGVLINDSDADDDTLTAQLVTGPANGTLALNADGSLTYQPNVDFNGQDGFTYVASDGVATSGPVEVTITVTSGQPDPPVAVADTFALLEDGTLTVDAPGVLANDSDPDGDAITASLVTGPANGSVTLNADGSFTYTPNQDFNGPTASPTRQTMRRSAAHQQRPRSR